MNIVIGGWNIYVEEDKTINYYQSEKEESDVNWDDFQARYQEVYEFLTSIRIDFKKPCYLDTDKRVIDDLRNIDLSYWYYGSINEYEYELDLGPISIVAYEDVDPYENCVMRFDLYNVWVAL